MKLSTLLVLGRISNLPTVWSNVLCGAVLSGAELAPARLLPVALAGSLFYVGGMLLNDAFDAQIDARERPERPIPSGQVGRREVFAWGFGLLGAGLALLVLVAALGGSASGFGLPAAGLSTALCVVVYDLWHKDRPFAPIVMGLCRAGLYCMGALTVAPLLDESVALGASALALYIVGLTHIARFETASVVARTWPTLFVIAPFAFAALQPSAWRPDASTLFAIVLWLGAVSFALWAIRLALLGGPGRIPRAVVSLIAGIALVDAAIMASRGAPVAAVFGVLAFALTLRLQRRIRGT